MSVADPIAWEAIEDALWKWIHNATAITPDRVRVIAPRDSGEARGPLPKATIQLISLVPLQQQGRENQKRVMVQRYTVIAGPGEVGVDFYPATSATAQRISIVAGAGDPPATSATALLGQLTADLPVGYTAAADPEDTASVLVTGTDDEPLFESVTADASLLTVFTVIPRTVVILKIESNIVWRVSFRADPTAGATFASNAMAQSMMMRRSYLDPAMRKVGFRTAGTPLSRSTIPTTRRDSTAELDVRYRGWMTGAQASQAMRRASVTPSVAA